MLIKSSLKHLRLVASHAARKTINAIDVKGLNSTFITNRIVHELPPLVKITIAQEVEDLEIPDRVNQTTVVGSVIQSLWPDVIHFVQESVKEYKREPKNSISLIDSVLSKLQPVIQKNVIKTLKAPEYIDLDSESIIRQIIKEIRTLLQVGDIKEKEVFKAHQKSGIAEDILVQDMKI